MDDVSTILFGSFPRSLGDPYQYWAFNESMFDDYVGPRKGRKNIYSSISQRTIEDDVYVYKTSELFFDLDSDVKKAKYGEDEDRELVREIKQDQSIANILLNGVCADAREVAQYCQTRDLPLIGVYTGFGIHLHLLTETVISTGNYTDNSFNGKKVMETNIERLIDILDLSTPDPKVIGDPTRFCRIPNCPRIEDGERTDLMIVPLSRDELAEVTPKDLIRYSERPRMVGEPEGERPALEMKDDYKDARTTKEFHKDPGEITNADGEYSQIIDEYIEMPCLREWIKSNDPPHPVRMNVAVQLFNYGFDVEEVFYAFKELRWSDWDADITRSQLRQIYAGNYADMSCETLQKKRLCVRVDEECPSRGYCGGFTRKELEVDTEP